MLTYRCNAQCTDCGTFSSPHDKSAVELLDVLRTIEDARDLGFHNVVFTGGEATLRWEELLSALRHAKTLDLPSRLVTNGQWAATPNGAIARLDELIDAGLGEINLSTGDEHARFVPLTSIAHAACAALARRMRIAIMIEVRHTPVVIKDDVLSLIEAGGGSRADRLLSFVESPWMPTNGYAPGTHPPELAATADNLAARRGCDSVLQTFVLQGNGRFASCCGLGMRRVRELQHGWAQRGDTLSDAVDQAESDLVKYALHTIGPEKLLAWAASHDPRIRWEGLYAHRCHACLRLYQDPLVNDIIRAKIYDLLPDIVFGHFADNIALPSLFTSQNPPEID